MNRLENKVAIITGGAGSIGKTTAKLFLEEGAKVMLVDLYKDALKKTVLELDSKNVFYCVADVSQSYQVEHYIQHTLKLLGVLDIFFNNAGIEGVVKPLVDYPEDIFDQVMSVNVKGIWLGNKYALKHLRHGGSIIMTSSVAGLQGFAGLGAYVASKHAVVGLMKTFAIEAAPLNIRVNSIHPGPVNNAMMRSIEEGASGGKGEEVKKQFESSILFGRYAEPLEVAQLVLFLAGDESRYITGTMQIIDGGTSAR